MPTNFAQAISGVGLQTSEATLGTTRNRECGQVPRFHNAHALRSARGLSKLPAEILFGLMTGLDPVTQMCLGLTCRWLHRAFHSIHGGEGEGWNINRRPFDLRMQVSLCGKYVLNWWWDDWFLRDSHDIEWDSCLGALLCEEKWLWGDLRLCEQCFKYKPQTAFGDFAWETHMLNKHKAVFECQFPRLQDDSGYWSKDWGCKRCRAKELLLKVEGRSEVLEDGDVREHRKSLGLLDCVAWEIETPSDAYESWENIFVKLDI